MVSMPVFQTGYVSSILITCSNMRLVLDGIEDRSYKPAHIVRLYGGVPDAVSALTSAIKKYLLSNK